MRISDNLNAHTSHISMLGVPLDAGASQRGCIMGPASFRVAGLGEELQTLGLLVNDLGDASPEDVSSEISEHEHVKNLPEIAGWTRSLFKHAYELAQKDTFPIYFGGDHSLSLGTVAGHAAAAAKAERPLFVLWLDAHADFNTFMTTESGNLHGTPLAYVCGQKGFEPLLGKALDSVVDPRNICIFGLRSVDRKERELVIEEGIEVHDMRNIDEHGVGKLITPFLERVAAANGLLHVSLDVDFLEPEIAPAVGTTVPGGATFREAHLVMEILHDSGLVTSLDLVELNPFLDDKGRTARLMVDLVASLFGRCVIDRKTRSV